MSENKGQKMEKQSGKEKEVGQDKDKPKTFREFIKGWPLGIFLMGLLAFTLLRPTGSAYEEVPLSEIRASIVAGEVTTATVNDSSRLLQVELKDGTKEESGYPTLYGGTLVDLLEKNDVEVQAEPTEADSPFINLLFTLLPVLLIIAFLIFFMRGRGMGGLGIGKLSKNRGAPVEVPETRFTDIAGADEVVAELTEVTDFLKDPEKFTSTGARMPRGFLLSGSPGTGKTLLARAVAGEAGVPFFALSGSDFVETFVGVGAGRVRELFEKAKAAGRAIIFIDEIDAIGKARTSGVQTGANEERENTLNALLTEMDGFAQTSGIIMLAATNRPDILDAALTRPGRFDRKIDVPAPDRYGREQIFKLHSKHLSLEVDTSFAGLARRTPGLTGAEIAGLVNEAALEAARRGEKVVTGKHFESALQTTVLGRERRSMVVSERDQRIVAWHEAGHAVAALVLPSAQDPVVVSIVPRGPTGGTTWMGGDDHNLTTRSQDLAQLVVAMSGRAAEEMLLDGDFTNGASGDLSSATSLAHTMIARYGMGKQLVAIDPERMSGEDLSRLNEEVSEILAQKLTEARELLSVHKDLMRRVASELIEHEILHLEDLRRIQLDITEGGGSVVQLAKQKTA